MSEETKPAIIESSSTDDVRHRADVIFALQCDENYKRTDRLFGFLLCFQWLGAIVLALIVSPRAWAGTISQPHIHLLAAIVLGGIIIALPVYLAFRQPGLPLTRHIIAAGQLLLSLLLIHITGGRIETHFHVFGSLAFLAFYRDWKVLITASIVVAIDHFLRGLLWPQSVYGILEVQPWRWLEHAAWVAFEDAFLIVAIRQSIREMHRSSWQQAELAMAHTRLLERSEKLEQSEMVLSERLDAALKDLIQARDAALASSRLKSEFLANMSHEIRTPMNAVIGMTEILYCNSKDETERQRLSVIKEAGQGLLAIIGDILDFSKIEAGKMVIEVSEFDLVTAVEGMAEILGSQARAKGIALLTYVDPQIPRIVRSDPVRLRQVLVNLVGNAIKFTEIGHVIVRVELKSIDENKAIVTFATDDTGIGMTEDELKLLFNPFVQADGSTTRKFSGTGLGLSICKRLIELMNGTIGVESVKGKGSIFHFSLPFEYEKASSHKDSLVTKELVGMRVLIVDDDPASSEILGLYLKKWKIDSLSVKSAPEALALMKAEANRGTPFDIAIVDLFMPGMDALQMQAEIERVPEIAPTKLILITAFDKQGQDLRVLSTGFKAYLRKPVKQMELIRALLSLTVPDQAIEDNPAPGATRTVKDKRQKPTESSVRILVVEDHPANQFVIESQLAELGYKIHLAGNGREALNEISEHDYELIFMDCMMPEMDGFQATAAIRRKEISTGRHVPIVAMTARAMSDDREKCLAAGMDDYLSKPIELESLRRALKKWLPDDLHTAKSGQAANVDETLVADDIVIDIEPLETMFGADGVETLIRIHCEESESILIRLTQALAGRDAHEVAAQAHRLKGACASLRCGRMRAACLEIERHTRSQDWEGIQSAITDLSVAFDRVREAVSKWSQKTCGN